MFSYLVAHVVSTDIDATIAWVVLIVEIMMSAVIAVIYGWIVTVVVASVIGWV